MNLFWIFLGICGVIFLVLAIAFNNAPMGWEDDDGWHRGVKK